MQRKSRNERLANFEIMDCTAIPTVADLRCDRLDFTSEVFDKRIMHQDSSPFDETLRLIGHFTTVAKEAPPATEAVVFTHTSKIGEWMCRVDAYVDSPTGLRCLEFSEVHP